jgi:dinuclear metal center YbgI/SA1388 family protein
MSIHDIINALNFYADPSLQEDYDNAGLITGNKNWAFSGALVCLDATEAVIQEAIDKKINLVIAHHPILFKGLKKINGNNYVERALILAIKHDIALFAIHTNLDNVIHGVNGKIADMLGLQNRQILAPKKALLQQLSVFVPTAHKESLLNALFAAGAGSIGNYSECSFTVVGEGSFKAMEGSTPFVGNMGERHLEVEEKIDVTFPAWKQHSIVQAMKTNHPYEEVAYYIYNLDNVYAEIGSGMLGDLPEKMDEAAFFKKIHQLFQIPVIKHSVFRNKSIQKVAICGGAGSFLTKNAIAAGADVYLTGDLKYHEFFDADQQLVLADIGHYESEQYTIELLFDFLRGKFPNFAVLKTSVNTNPVCYFK